MSPIHEPFFSRAGLSRSWLMLASYSLVFSGVFALAIGIARTPITSEYFNDPTFFRRSLIVHVNLGVLVWFTAVFATLVHLCAGNSSPKITSKLGFVLSLVGAGGITLTGLVSSGEPLLANYVPVVDDKKFIAALVVYFIGIALTMLEGVRFKKEHLYKSALPGPLGEAMIHSSAGVRMGALYTLFALATFFASWLHTSQDMPPAVTYELRMWGGGHVLQFANVSFLLVSWSVLFAQSTGRPWLRHETAFWIFAWVGLPLIIIPFLSWADVTGSLHRNGFTQLMRWGLFPPVLTYLILGWIQNRRLLPWSDPRFHCFFASVILILTGFVFGALVRGPDLRLPGHYHASIGAVTLSFMGLAVVLFEALISGRKGLSSRKTYSSMVWLYAVGQWAFAAGMFIAGFNGMGRKIYGTEQQIRNLGQTVGMGIMGVGGLVALAGGLCFMILVLKRSSHPSGSVLSERDAG